MPDRFFAAGFRGLLAVSLCGAACAQSSGRQVDERFNTRWVPSTNPNSGGEPTDGVFKVDGNYCVPYGDAHTDEFNIGNVTFHRAPHDSVAHLIVRAGTHTATSCGGVIAYGAAEIASNAGWEPTGSPPPPFGNSPYNYGYYEAEMRPSCVQGEISSFFWIAAPHYGPLEIDVEFPDAPGHVFNDVHWTIHPSGQTVDYPLGFNPCQAMHRYGFLWTAGQLVFTVDGHAKQTFNDTTLNTNQTGFIIANAWTGHAAWGGGPPSQDAVNDYRFIKFIPNATTIPPQ